MANESMIHIDQDDYTELEEAANKRSKKNADKSISSTQETSLKDANSGKGMSLGVKLMIGKEVVGSMRTDHMQKTYKKDERTYTKESQQNKSHSGADKTMGDVFASAFQRIQLEQKAEKMRKLQEKIQKREAREKKMGDMINNVMQAVGQASRTSAMQNSMGQLTANTAGVAQRDIPTLNDGRSDDDQEFGQ